MNALGAFFRSPAGRVCVTGILVVMVAVLVWSVWSQVGTDPTVELANSPLFIDAETKQTFRAKLQVGTEVPVVSPFTGHATGYEAELCFWTRDGKPKTDPTPVLLREYLHESGPTFCPDCGRLVVHHNPPATAGHRPPPSQTEYAMTRLNAANPPQDLK